MRRSKFVRSLFLTDVVFFRCRTSTDFLRCVDSNFDEERDSECLFEGDSEAILLSREMDSVDSIG